MLVLLDVIIISLPEFRACFYVTLLLFHDRIIYICLIAFVSNEKIHNSYLF